MSIEFIAEIGGNFKTIDEGIALVDAAIESGADAVKLQTFKAETIASPSAVFHLENTGLRNQRELFRALELSESLHQDLFTYCKKQSIEIFSTPSHVSDLILLERLGVSRYKTGSDDAVNIPFLEQIAKLGKPLIYSTGMCTLTEVVESVEAIRLAGCNDLTILHATSCYPLHDSDANLLAIRTLKKRFPDCRVGYSCHATDPLVAYTAVVLGATVIEKHFTLDKKACGPDHMLSATPEEFAWLVSSSRRLHQLLGNGAKMPVESELQHRGHNRKSVVFARDMSKGERIEPTDLDIKRPGYGLPPKALSSLIGKTLIVDVLSDDLVVPDNFQ